MEPVSQAILGVMGQGIVSKSETLKSTHFKRCLFGAVGGLAPDIDYLIRVSHDPLFTIEYHRQFTHSLFFIPFGALLLSLFFKLFKIKISDSYPYLFLGFATHGLLDAFTNYGTQLWWPFSDKREAWNCLAVVDPFLTIPLIILTFLFIKTKRKKFNFLSWLYILSYISFSFFQKQRVENFLFEKNILTKSKDPVVRVMIKPTIANNFIWRVIIDDGQKLSFYGVRLGFFDDDILYTGKSRKKVRENEINTLIQGNLTQLHDYKRFKYFCDDYLIWVDESSIGDGRYSLLAHGDDPIWYIKFFPKEERHIEFVTIRKPNELEKMNFKNIWLGQGLNEL